MRCGLGASWSIQPTPNQWYEADRPSRQALHVGRASGNPGVHLEALLLLSTLSIPELPLLPLPKAEPEPEPSPCPPAPEDLDNLFMALSMIFSRRSNLSSSS
mmetsp:Transcript_70185/g.201129  ORF Transcript_70185/g.201129 Transcript_70185/m.201129 type:complete len:102 (-) Transcript_70185:915-1220(-)